MREDQIKHDTQQQQFIWDIDGQIAILDYVTLSDSVYAYTHVYVPPALRGQNIAARLTQFALEEASKLGWKVKAVCPYIQTYTRRHSIDLEPIMV
ncbi:GNAT family N-acetyltransferase [Membranihabitans marinus]|uniref:GNAT family N-acetyltransferase n=1 Tax=Membranihabitans marinus TaxID=1227546 RepID=UPI001F3C9481|nr:GNAT family N-acetyltransferase [Membranihabitans marinus]